MMSDWEGATYDRANFDKGQSSEGQPPAHYSKAIGETSARQISASVRAILGKDFFGGSGEFNSRFVCPLSVLEVAVRDIVELAHNGSTALIVERLAKVPTEARGKLEILRNAVRLMGENWCSDAVDFVTLSTAVGRLQCALRKISRDCAPIPSVNSPTLQILLPRREEHTFAACYLEELARLDGWSVEICDRDYGKRVAASAETGVPQAVCLMWSHEAEMADIEAILIELSLIVSKTEIFFYSGGPSAIRSADWLKTHGINGVFDCFDTALRVSKKMLCGSDCNRAFARLPETTSVPSRLSK